MANFHVIWRGKGDYQYVGVYDAVSEQEAVTAAARAHGAAGRYLAFQNNAVERFDVTFSNEPTVTPV